MEEKSLWKRTHCARMDHGGCTLLVEVKDNKIIRVKGAPDGFLNKGYVCPKGLASPEKLTHPHRLKSPLKRVGKRGEGKWEEITWDEALAAIIKNLNNTRERFGAKSVAFCQGMPKGMEHFALIKLANLFGSPNVVAVQDVCHAPREVVGNHTCGFYPVADLRHKSDLVILWGSNITSTNEEGAICSLLLHQLKEGTRLITVDPRKTRLAGRSDHWLQLKPGTDGVLALAFINVIIEEELFDREFVEKWTSGFAELADHVKGITPEVAAKITWVPAEVIRSSARAYAEAPRAAIQWGNPIEQNRANFDTIRALTCLMAICGNLDVPGGNVAAVEPDILGLGKFVRAGMFPEKRKEMIHAHHRTIPGLMTVPPAFFKKAVLEEVPYPVKAAYVQCANPMLSFADSRETERALAALDFLAVTDIFMTPTAAMADIVLPAATQFEFDDIGHYGLGHGFILARPKIVDPPQGCWPDIKIINALGRSLTGEEFWYQDYREMLDEVLAPAGLTFEAFVEKGHLEGKPAYRKYEQKGFKTPTGKVELVLSKAEKFGLSPLPGFGHLPGEEDDDFPLILTSAKNASYLHSSYRWVESLRKRSPHPVVEIHPHTAAEQGIKENDEVVIETPSGSIVQRAALTDKVHRRVVCVSYGWWFPEEGGDLRKGWESSNFNMLTSTKKLGKEFGTPELKGINCRIKKAGSSR